MWCIVVGCGRAKHDMFLLVIVEKFDAREFAINVSRTLHHGGIVRSQNRIGICGEVKDGGGGNTLGVGCPQSKYFIL